MIDSSTPVLTLSDLLFLQKFYVSISESWPRRFPSPEWLKLPEPSGELSKPDFAGPPPPYPVDHKSSAPFSALTERLK